MEHAKENIQPLLDWLSNPDNWEKTRTGRLKRVSHNDLRCAYEKVPYFKQLTQPQQAKIVYASLCPIEFVDWEPNKWFQEAWATAKTRNKKPKVLP